MRSGNEKRRINEMDKISLVIPVKNEADKIERCFEAVFNQTMKPFEVMIVDVHSRDKIVGNMFKKEVLS